MNDKPLHPALQSGLIASLWVTGVFSLLMVKFGVGGTLLELFEGMNLQLPLPTKVLMQVGRVMEIQGGSGFLTVLWTGAVVMLHQRIKETDGATAVAWILLLFSICQIGFLLTMFSAGLPLYQLIGNLG